jgi:hypothetical protein
MVLIAHRIFAVAISKCLMADSIIFGALGDFDAIREASGLLMGLALHLCRALGANAAELSGHWIGTAKGLGALDDF